MVPGTDRRVKPGQWNRGRRRVAPVLGGRRACVLSYPGAKKDVSHMSRTARWVSVSLAAMIAGLSLSAMAQQTNDPRQPNNRPQGQPNRSGPAAQPRSGPAQGAQQYRGPVGPATGSQQYRGPGVQGTQQYRGPVGPATGSQQYRGPVQGAQQYRGPAGGAQGQQFRGATRSDQFRSGAVVGQRGYSFRAGFQGRRVVGTFNDRERAAWYGGRWRHEQRFGRYGYWWEVGGVWYFYDQPFDGPPDYVSEAEYPDDGPGPDSDYAPGVADEPMPAGPPVVYGPPVYGPPVYVPPPVVCVGPFCVR